MVKRAIDLLLVLLAAPLWLPLLAATALAVRLCLGRPVLFRQARPGLHGRLFTLVKFRSMRAGPGSDAERLTPFGRRLRRTSLDELPEFWNVLRGEMSLVGPRPLLPEYLPRYTPEQARRHEVRPGITGWAQIHGRNAATWEERLRLDVWYVDHRSLGLDAWILVRTIGTIFCGRGISARTHATMSQFPGASS